MWRGAEESSEKEKRSTRHPFFFPVAVSPAFSHIPGAQASLLTITRDTASQIARLHFSQRKRDPEVLTSPRNASLARFERDIRTFFQPSNSPCPESAPGSSRPSQASYYLLLDPRTRPGGVAPANSSLANFSSRRKCRDSARASAPRTIAPAPSTSQCRSSMRYDRAHASHFHTGRRPLSPAPVVTLPTRPRLRSLPLLLFPYYQYQRAHLI